MADFKDLHTKWSVAKKAAKLAWDSLGRMTMNISSATNVTYGVVSFPKFDKALGASLDELQKFTTKKDVKDLTGHKNDLKKYKENANKAITQYENDIKAMDESATKVKVPEKNGKNDKNVEMLHNVLQLVKQELKDLQEALKNAKTAVSTIKDG